MKRPNTLLLLCALLAGTATVHAASHGGAPVGEAKHDTVAKGHADMADGEIRKVDVESKKITIKHGVIKSLDMPPMTMVFQVKDSALLSRVKAGDKVRFSAEKAGSAMVVTDIQPAK